MGLMTQQGEDEAKKLFRDSVIAMGQQLQPRHHPHQPFPYPTEISSVSSLSLGQIEAATQQSQLVISGLVKEGVNHIHELVRSGVDHIQLVVAEEDLWT